MPASIAVYIIYLYAFLLVFIHIFIITGLVLAFRQEKKAEKSGRVHDADSTHPDKLKITVIVPARNEALFMPSLFNSLLKQTVDDFEIVLVNDRSEDDTLRLMEDFRSRYPGRVKVVDNKESFPDKNPKQMALSLAESRAEGDIFLYTDADCQVPDTWIEYMIKPFSDPAAGLVFGAVTVNPGKTLLENFQMFDHLLRYHYTAASAGLGVPTGGFGNNLAVRREALESIGGFAALKYTVTEDAQLIATIRDTGRWKILPQTSLLATVSTAPVKTWKELYEQELRWSTGALHAPDIMAMAGYGFIMYQLVTGLAVLPFVFINPYFLAAFFAGIISMLSVMTAVGIHIKAGKSFWRITAVSLFIAEFLFPVVIVRATFKSRLIWKGTRL